MRRAMWTVPIAVGWLVGCHPAAATPTGTAPRPPLVPEMRRLSFYVGEWQCRGVATDDDGSQHVYDSLRISVAPVLDGSWLEVRVFENGVPATSELKGYDRHARRYRHVWAAGEGQSGSYSSAGWVGNRMVFDADHPASGRRERAIFTMLSDTRYSHRSEVDAGEGYRVDFEKTCRKRT
jgi:hypothetical protein